MSTTNGPRSESLDVQIRIRMLENLSRNSGVLEAAESTCRALRDEASALGWGDDLAAALFLYAADVIKDDITTATKAALATQQRGPTIAAQTNDGRLVVIAETNHVEMS